MATVYWIAAALEIVHYGDPPTGVIESLLGILIIAQSRAAHREIEELLDELSEGHSSREERWRTEVRRRELAWSLDGP